MSVLSQLTNVSNDQLIRVAVVVRERAQYIVITVRFIIARACVCVRRLVWCSRKVIFISVVRRLITVRSCGMKLGTLVRPQQLLHGGLCGCVRGSSNSCCRPVPVLPGRGTQRKREKNATF